jgi:hypothetical protein
MYGLSQHQLKKKAESGKKKEVEILGNKGGVMRPKKQCELSLKTFVP